LVATDLKLAETGYASIDRVTLFKLQSFDTAAGIRMASPFLEVLKSI